jgi:hypothetical protein
MCRGLQLHLEALAGLRPARSVEAGDAIETDTPLVEQAPHLRPGYLQAAAKDGGDIAE